MNIKKRGRYYHLRRRVPLRYREVDHRDTIHLSLKTDSFSQAEDRARAAWDKLLLQWECLLRGDVEGARAQQDAAKELAQSYGFEWLSVEDVRKRPLPELVRRVEKSIGRDGKINDVKARALLGVGSKLRVSDCLEIFFELTKDEAARKSPNQRRVWSNNFKRAVQVFLAAAGDIEAGSISPGDMMRMRDHLAERVEKGKIKAATANKELKLFGTVMRRVNKAKELKLELEILSGWAFRGAEDGVRVPFTTRWIRETLVEGSALEGLNPQARAIVRVMINTGMRPSEVAGLLPENIKLGHEVPHLVIEPRTEGEHVRQVKTKSARRVLPLLGVSLNAISDFANGFPRYYDNPGLSQTINKYLRERKLMESEHHTLYCLRHSFEDRMLEAGIDERLRRDFLGHRLDRERYGMGGDLIFRRNQLAKVAL
ncbi:MAG: tyrosine-type recombinase/integrase [Sulfitobacter sp.]|nr:tyrosine-type recombinase/integrase [Sulfitobacter sp.]